MFKKFSLKTIQQQLSTLTYDQIELLFFTFKQLNLDRNFFSTEKSHMKFIVDLFELPCNRNPSSFKTFITYSIPKYTSKSKYPRLLQTIEMIKKDYTLNQVINNLIKK